MRRILALVLSLALAGSFMVPAFAQTPFGDVADSHWAAAAIRRANEDGVMVGTGTFPETGLARFDPDASLTAAQFVTIVVQGFYPDKIDLEVEGAWYMPYIAAAEDAGLFAGVSFEKWEEPMTRYNMAGMLYNVLWDKAISFPDQERLAGAQAKIADWDQVPEEYRTAVSISYAMGLLSGTDEAGTFAGTQILNRAQAAVVYGKLADAVDPKNQAPDTDPMQVKLDRLIAVIEDWAQISSGNYQLYPWEGGTVFVGYQGGLPHGGTTTMTHVDKTGAELSINDMLPNYFMYGSYRYFAPRDIQVSEDGRLTFVTPITEGKGGFGEPEEVKDWGDTLCTVDLTTGTMVSMEPVE